MTNYSRSVLKSNGLHCPKIRLKKFGFSSKSVPANIAKKLPLQLRPKPLFIAFFNFSHKRPTFALAPESGYTLGSLRKIAHSGLHDETGVFRTGVVSLPSNCSTRFGNPAWPGVRTAYFAAFGSWPDVLPKDTESLRDSDALMRVAVPRRRGPAGLRDPMAASLHRGTPRFCSTVITECGEKHTSFLCTELLCQLCLRLPPLCCTL